MLFDFKSTSYTVQMHEGGQIKKKKEKKMIIIERD